MLGRLLSRWKRRPGAPVVPLVLYSRADCPLCEQMKAAIADARTPHAFELREVDIAGDPELEERFGRSIPVLEIAGRVAFKGRLTLDAFERRLARAAASAPPRAGGATR